MRYFYFFILFIGTSFSFGEICETTTVYVRDMNRSLSEKYDSWVIEEIRSDGKTVKLKEAWKNGLKVCAGCGHPIKSYPKETTTCKPSGGIIDQWNNCKSGKDKVDYIKKMTVEVGGKKSTVSDRYTSYFCDDPNIDYEYMHPRSIEDESFDEKYTCTGSACDSLDHTKLEEVPCFGSMCNPNYKDGETYRGEYNGVPCFSSTISACENWAPDYINGNGVPCWGDFCPNDGKAPIYKDEKGKTCVGSYCEGANGSTNTGNTVTNGEHLGGSGGSSSGGGGEGEAGFGDFDFGILPTLGEVDMPKVPDSFWKRKHENESFESIYNRNISKVLPDLNQYGGNLGTGICPKFTFDIIGDISIPCYAWDWLRVFFYAVTSWFCFMIIFKRGS